jgi:phosphoribosylanthranilate isomerase
MTNLEDALVAVEAGADAVGFVFYEKSPRCVSVERAREIVEKLPETVEKIGVFVDQDADPNGVLLEAGLTGTQSYLSEEGVAGSRSHRWIGTGCLAPNARFLIAMPVSFFGEDGSQIEQAMAGLAASRKRAPEGFPLEGLWDTVLLDSGNPCRPGGTGKTFDWGKARALAHGMKKDGLNLVVAGGLTPENVGQAIDILQPWGVDVASGVEERPGKKDPEKVRAFVRAVRDMDQKTG